MSLLPTPAERVMLARNAQLLWSALPARERCRRLRPLRRILAGRIDEVVRVLGEETGKTPLDALGGDLMVTLEHMRFYERHASRILASRRVGKPPFFFTGTRFTEHYQPHGVALILAPWNYPLQLSLVPAITALAAGNAVLLKCSERTPRLTALLAELFRQAALPEGLVQLSAEDPGEAARLIDAQPDIVFFTGSSGNGQQVAACAAVHLIPCILELGGKDACLVFAGCDLARAIEGAVYGAFSNAGQVCVGIKRIYVEEPIYPAFLSAYIDRVRRLRLGQTADADYGPIPFASVRQALADQVHDAIAHGAQAHTPLSFETEAVTPIILTDVPPDARLLTQESFGPVVCVQPFQTEEEAIRLANSTPFALSASIFSGSTHRAARLARRLHAGSCSINDAIRNIGNPYAAFGGNRASGYGRYHGAAGLLAFSRIQSIMEARSTSPSEVHWFPSTARTVSRMQALLAARHGSGSWPQRLRRLRNLLPLLAIALHGCVLARIHLIATIAVPPHLALPPQ